MKRAPAAKHSSTRRKPQARGEVTRERLLEVALDQFVRHGFHGTSMRQIADAAGVAVGGIYNHFGSKEEVFAAVLDANHPYRLVEAVLREVSEDNLEAFVRETASRVWAAVKGRQSQLMALMFIEMVEFQGRHMRAVAETLFPKVLSRVQHLERGAEQRRALPDPVILRGFVDLMVGHLITSTILGGLPMFAQLGEDGLEGVIELFLHGALKPKA